MRVCLLKKLFFTAYKIGLIGCVGLGVRPLLGEGSGVAFCICKGDVFLDGEELIFVSALEHECEVGECICCAVDGVGTFAKKAGKGCGGGVEFNLAFGVGAR